jgi:competence protein ComEA
LLVLDSQKLGAVAVLTVCLLLYGAFLYHSRLPVRETPLPWGEQGPGLIALELADENRGGAIYFLPEETTIEQIRESIGIPKMPEISDLRNIKEMGISSGSTLMISPSRELKIGDMIAARKMALGLPLDLNQVSEEDLSLVPGIGEKTAFQIVRVRNEKGAFRDLSDLMTVPGIKEKKFNAIKVYFIVKPTS